MDIKTNKRATRPAYTNWGRTKKMATVNGKYILNGSRCNTDNLHRMDTGSQMYHTGNSGMLHND